ncbi:iron(III) ABC transporter, permease [Galbibacter marinus]|uniref:Iron(III) ABC transporter, permease n=1 Tax=Galbibacter marinus TaxID=555500 RepID=K2Q6G6_9FLAO|nr:iron ABC transporter permease [Galbibacter marinus]EKF56456.1 iron(III) ABC transporter, permease [Galbibacter marinus]
MNTTKSYYPSLLILGVFLIVSFVVNLSLGSVSIPAKEVIYALLDRPVADESWRYIIVNYRLPKSLTAILVGSGLSLSGLLMQTLFRNPLAGPFVLGISSGASLGVALLIMGTSIFGGVIGFGLGYSAGTIIAATVGSFLVLSAIMIVASAVKDTMTLLIIGLMFGSITSSVVSVLSYFTQKEQLQQYIFWSFGSLGNLSWNQLLLLCVFVVLGVLIAIYCIKPLNALLLGEHYAFSLGINVKRSRYLIIISTSLLAGSITAFAGPIAFIGLAVPHLSRQLFPTQNHKIMIPATVCFGAMIMLLCDTVAQLPGSTLTLPINAITSLVGAPVIIWLLVRKRKMIF